MWLDVPTDAAEAPTACVALSRDRTASLTFSLAIGMSLGFISGVSFTVNSGLSLHAAGLASLLLGILGSAAAGAGSGYVAYGRAGCIAFGVAGSAAGVLASAVCCDNPVRYTSSDMSGSAITLPIPIRVTPCRGAPPKTGG